MAKAFIENFTDARRVSTPFVAVDRDCLVAALNEQGYKEVEVHDVAVQLYDFQGRPTHYLDADGDKGNVIVRRHVIGGAANDLGFRKEIDGTYTAIGMHKHNEGWMKALKRSYTEKVDMKLASKMGAKLISRKVVNGKIQLQFLDRRA